VLQNVDPGDEGAPRPPWQWVGFGALAIVTAWVPLAALGTALAEPLAERAEDSAAAVLLVFVAAYAAVLGLGAAMGGYLVGRWGARGVGLREAALAGVLAAIVAVGVTWSAFGPSAGALLVIPLATALAAAGGRWGLRSRGRPPVP
jgi:hypothetical protein